MMLAPTESRSMMIAAAIVIAALAFAFVAMSTAKMHSNSKKIDHDSTCENDMIISSEHSFSNDLLSATIEKVYLFTFPRVHHVHNISPFSLKVESFLRMNNIRYEVIPTFKFSPKGQIPYIRLNSKDGPLIADSNFIIRYLSKQLGLDKVENDFLTSNERSVSHAFTRMIEEHTTQIGFYYRYGLNMNKFCSAVIPFNWFDINGPLTKKGKLFLKFWMFVQPLAFNKKMRYLSCGRHSDEEKWTISCQDIQSISDYLADKTFIFGDSATALDCTLFGHFAQFLYIPLDFPQKRYIHQNCDNIVQYVERFKELYWKDHWDSAF